MKSELLSNHIKDYLAKQKANPTAFNADLKEGKDRSVYYQSWTVERLRQMTEDDLAAFVSQLWAMRIWGNMQYVVDKLIEDHGLPKVREELAAVVWSDQPSGFPGRFRSGSAAVLVV